MATPFTRLLSVGAASLLIAAAVITAQTPGSQVPADVSTLPRFDVVSVKPNASGGAMPSLPNVTPGRVSVSNVGLRQLIQMSHDIQSYQLADLPSWAETARFDLTGTSSSSTTPAQMMLMVRGLLADRFQFVAGRMAARRASDA